MSDSPPDGRLRVRRPSAIAFAGLRHDFLAVLYLLVVLALTEVGSAAAQQRPAPGSEAVGSIRGRVQEADTGLPLPGAAVVLAVRTDLQGGSAVSAPAFQQR